MSTASFYWNVLVREYQKEERVMAQIKIQFVCGCGFKTNSPVTATEHSDAEKHSLTIQGSVQKPVEK